MAIQAPTPRNERAQFLYLLWDDKFLTEKPYQVFVPLPDGVPEERQSNLKFTPSEEVVVTDIRGCPPDDFSLDTSGFVVAQYETKLGDFTDPYDIENIYLQEIEDLLRASVSDIEKIIIFDWRIRKSVETKLDATVNMDDKLTPLLPARHVHIDQTPWSAMKRVSLHAEEEISRFGKNGGRVRIVNAWRPIITQILDWPLALCDARSISDSELIAVDHVRRRYVGESYYMPFNAAHRWYYLRGQTKDEVLLFKNYDSGDVEGKYCPHASFQQSTVDQMATPRSSIEVRALIFSER